MLGDQLLKVPGSYGNTQVTLPPELRVLGDPYLLLPLT